MKFAEINAIYTKTVAEWLSKGYTINTDKTAGNSQASDAANDAADVCFTKRNQTQPNIIKHNNPHNNRN